MPAAPRSHDVRHVLLWLALACLLPGVLGAAALTAYQHAQRRHELELHTVMTARALMQAVDHHLLLVQAAAQALAPAASLGRGDLASFYNQASQTMTQLRLGSHALLRDRSGHQLLNTAVPFGQALSTPPASFQVEGVFETGQPSISDLYMEPIPPRAAMSVDVPVLIGGQVGYALGISVLPEHINDILRTQQLPDNWVAGVLDQNGTFVARTHDAAHVVGRKGSPSLLLQLDRMVEGAGQTLTLEGVEVVSFHSRSPVTGWTVAIGIPRRVIAQDLLSTSGYLAGGIVLLFGAGGLLAWLIGGRIARAFEALSALAANLGAGRPVEPPALRIQEAQQVAADMRRAAGLLEEREATLRESEERFKALADNMAQLAWMADRHGRVLWFNRRWSDYTGAQAQGPAHPSWQARLHPDDAEGARSRWAEHLHSGQALEGTYRLQGRHGEYRWFLTSALPLRDRAGRITHWFGTHTDVTAQLQTQDALQQAHARKDEFIAVLAHELRNPLAPVRTAVELLHRAAPADTTLARACQTIERQVAHMAHLIDDLLDTARLASGKLSLALQRCDLAAIVQETAEDHRPSLEAAGLRLSVQTWAQPLCVQGDPVRLAQIVGNLLNNAGRFTDPGGCVEVRLGIQDGHALVTVTDDGVGIAPELMQRLFAPFSQASQDLARSKGGLGLGLALSQGLAQLQGGHLGAASPGLGQGSSFTLSLPLDTSAAPGAPPAPPPTSHRRGRVLVIEDNRDAGRTLVELLALSGNEVELAFDGDSGVQAARQFGPKVVISDIGLPGRTDGYAVARALRADPDLDKVYLIALSGYADAQSVQRARQAGFDRYLFKPVDLGELEDALEAALA